MEEKYDESPLFHMFGLPRLALPRTHVVHHLPLGMIVPIGEHDGENRRDTHAHGVGDARPGLVQQTHDGETQADAQHTCLSAHRRMMATYDHAPPLTLTYSVQRLIHCGRNMWDRPVESTSVISSRADGRGRVLGQRT
ncbi:hypothetical protein DOM01_28170, partial [Salmonella enterica subsp. enterica serovar Derby]